MHARERKNVGFAAAKHTHSRRTRTRETKTEKILIKCCSSVNSSRKFKYARLWSGAGLFFTRRCCFVCFYYVWGAFSVWHARIRRPTSQNRKPNEHRMKCKMTKCCVRWYGRSEHTISKLGFVVCHSAFIIIIIIIVHTIIPQYNTDLSIVRWYTRAGECILGLSLR